MNWLIHIAAHLIIHVAWVLAPYVAYGQVCQIRSADGAVGSAVCIGTRTDDGTGVFFTAGHCIDRDGTWLAPEGKWLWAEPWAYYAAGPGKDFALVYCREYKPRAIYDIGKASPAIGSEVTVCGFARGGQLTVTKTRIRSYGTGYLNLECRGIQGVSGGPILVGKTVVGILTHDDYGDQCGIATNIETIHGALRSWRAHYDKTAWGFGVGVGGGRCGPYGCQPFVPVYPAVPAQPYYVPPQQPYVQSPSAPQQPGYPGFDTAPTQPTSPPVAYDDAEIKKRLSELELTDTEISLALKALASRTPKEGPQGPPGRDGKDIDPARLAALEERAAKHDAEIAAIRSIKIPVRIVDNTGKVLSEQAYELGKPLEFRFTEQK